MRFTKAKMMGRKMIGGLTVVVAAVLLAVAPASQAATLGLVSPSQGPLVATFSLGLNYDADAVSPTVGTLSIVNLGLSVTVPGSDSQSILAAGSMTNMDGFGTFMLSVDIDHSNATPKAIAGTLNVANSVLLPPNNINPLSGSLLLSSVTLKADAHPTQGGWGFQAFGGGNQLEFIFGQDVGTPFVILGGPIGVIIPTVRDATGAIVDLENLDLSQDFSDYTALKSDAFAIPLPSTVAMLMLGSAFLIRRPQREDENA